MGADMHNRLRLLMGATALLYLGPLMAGLAGFGWAVVPVFTLIFVLWLMILRPQHWPATRAEWQDPQALVTLLVQTAMQLLLVTVCFGIGRGIGGVLGAVPPLPLMLPIAISFLSIPLCRLVWDPAKVVAMDGVLDSALSQITTATDPQARRRRAMAARLLAPLAGLTDPTEAEVTRHLAAIRQTTDDAALRHALLAATEGQTAALGLRLALVLHATDRAAIDANGLPDYPGWAFARIGGDAALLTLFARRLTAALRADPALWGSCPQSARLREQAVMSADPDAAAALTELAQVVDDVAPPDAAT